jgi:hypothetical protein
MAKRKTYYRVSDGHMLSSGWITAETLAELRRKSKRPIRILETRTV